MTQNEQVLQHLKTFGCITALEAMKKYGIMRLASRINELRKLGFPVKSVMSTRRDASGKLKKWTVYYLEEKA